MSAVHAVAAALVAVAVFTAAVFAAALVAGDCRPRSQCLEAGGL